MADHRPSHPLLACDYCDEELQLEVRDVMHDAVDMIDGRLGVVPDGQERVVSAWHIRVDTELGGTDRMPCPRWSSR